LKADQKKKKDTGEPKNNIPYSGLGTQDYKSSLVLYYLQFLQYDLFKIIQMLFKTLYR